MKIANIAERFRSAGLQLACLGYELGLLVNHKWYRWFIIWFGGSAGVLISYRLDRFFFLLFGSAWAVGRVFLMPLWWLLRLLSANHQIHYRADIGKGLRILHPALGIVVSGYAVAGERLILTGGNCIGGRKSLQFGDLMIGDNVQLGANAVILGPVRVGSHTYIGAGAVVVHDTDGGVVLVGVPAKVLHRLSNSSVNENLDANL